MDEYIDRVIKRLEMGWTVKANARNKNEEVVSCRDGTAIKWCIVGAMVRECGYDVGLPQITYSLRDKLSEKLRGRGPLLHWHDNQTTIEPVIELLKSCKDAV